MYYTERLAEKNVSTRTHQEMR